MAKWRVAIIGRTGKGNYGHGIDTVWAEIPDCEVVAVADENDAGREVALKRTKAARGYADFREMLEKERPQIVGIGPRWLDQHREMVLAAAEQGCHIYMEKPFCRTLQEADEMLRAIEMRHLKVAIAHQTRYSPTVHQAKKLIAGGEIGEVLEVRGRGKEDASGGGEDLWVLGSHVFDLMRFLFGNPASCSATVLQDGHLVTKEDVREGNEGIGPLAGDSLHARFNFPNGVLGDFGSRKNRGESGQRFGIQVFGSKGIMEIPFGYQARIGLLRDSTWAPGRSGVKWEVVGSQGIGQPDVIPKNGLHDGNITAVTDLLACIGTERQPLCSALDGRWTVEMIAGIFESHRQRREVALPLVDRVNPLSRYL